MWWIYKCNAKNNAYQRDWGNWDHLFLADTPRYWGSTELIPELGKAQVGDLVIAYQTDRNELVGVAQVVRLRPNHGYCELILTPKEIIRAKVRPLKEDPRISKIPALRGGRIQTLYEISTNDATRLLVAARASARVNPREAELEATQAQRGAGFGTPEENRKVEAAAIDFVSKSLRQEGWTVENVSQQNRGYDLDCKHANKRLHVEVKGSRGRKVQFIITANEKSAWELDPKFVLALVTDALQAPEISMFYGAKGNIQFNFRPISFVAIHK